jgi:hypothetical protein
VSLLVAEQKRNVSACFNEDTCTYLHHVYHQVASGLLQKKGEEKGNHKGKLLREKHKPIGHKNKVGMISQALNTKKRQGTSRSNKTHLLCKRVLSDLYFLAQGQRLQLPDTRSHQGYRAKGDVHIFFVDRKKNF